MGQQNETVFIFVAYTSVSLMDYKLAAHQK